MKPFYAYCGVPRNEELRVSGVASVCRGADSPRMPKTSAPMSPDAIQMQRNLRLWRKSRNLTLSALAEQIGSKVSTISGWETGTRSVDTTDLHRLAKFYGVHPAALLFAPEEGGPRVQQMIEASGIAERLSEDAAREWISVGRRMARPDEKV